MTADDRIEDAKARLRAAAVQLAAARTGLDEAEQDLWDAHHDAFGSPKYARERYAEDRQAVYDEIGFRR